MVTWYLRYVVLKLSVLCCAMPFVKPNIGTLKPVVPQYCEQLCNETTESCSCVYRVRDLSCRLSYTMSNQQSPGTKLEVAGLDSSACPNDVNIRRNNLGIASCQLEEETDKARILMLPYSGSHKGRQLFLHNDSVEPYPYITDRLWAVAFLSVSRRLFASPMGGKGVFSVPLDGKKKTIITRREHVLHLTVDEESQLVFMINMHTDICVMSTNGKGFKPVASLKWRVRDIDADPKRRIIYVICRILGRYEVSTFTYLGICLGKVFTAREIFIDVKRDVLYYIPTNAGHIYEMALSDNITVAHKSLNILSAIDTVLVIGVKFYLARTESHEYIIIFKENDAHVMLHTGYNSYARVKFCLIH